MLSGTRYFCTSQVERHHHEPHRAYAVLHRVAGSASGWANNSGAQGTHKGLARARRLQRRFGIAASRRAVVETIGGPACGSVATTSAGHDGVGACQHRFMTLRNHASVSAPRLSMLSRPLALFKSSRRCAKPFDPPFIFVVTPTTSSLSASLLRSFLT